MHAQCCHFQAQGQGGLPTPPHFSACKMERTRYDFTASPRCVHSVLCIPGHVPKAGALCEEGYRKGSPGVLEKRFGGGVWPAFHPLTFPSHWVPTSLVPPLYREVGESTSFRISSGCKWLEPIVNRKTQIETVTSKPQTARSVSCKPPAWMGGGSLVVPGTTDDRPVAGSQASGCFGAALTPQIPSPPVPSREGIAKSSESARAPPRRPPDPAPARPGSRRSQSARALRVTSPGPGINCQVSPPPLSLFRAN